VLKNPKVVLLIILALVGAAIFLAFQKPPKLGLDLKGGTRLTLEAVPTEAVPQVTPQVMDSLLFVIEKRVNSMGIGETLVQKSGNNRLIVEIPGIKDPEEAKRTLGRVGNLEFRRFEKGAWVPSGVSGKDLAKADVGTDSGGGWVILFELNAQGTDAFGNLTSQLSPNHEPLGIFFDGKMISAPRVNEPILQGNGQITGKFTHDEAKDLVDVLNAGALPVDIDVVEEATVGTLVGCSLHSSEFIGRLGGLRGCCPVYADLLPLARLGGRHRLGGLYRFNLRHVLAVWRNVYPGGHCRVYFKYWDGGRRQHPDI
jgi:preprotein translocase subunit SecD